MAFPFLGNFSGDIAVYTPLLFAALAGLAHARLADLGDATAPDGDNIELLEQQLEELQQLEAKIKSDFSQTLITENHYNQSMTRLLQVRKDIEAKLADSIVAMIAPVNLAQPQPAAVSDPLATASAPTNDEHDTAVKIMSVKRGLLNNARAFEIKFLFRGQQAKAVINSDEGHWHFRGQADGMYHGQFILGLEKSNLFAEVFEKEFSRHQLAWNDLVVAGVPYTHGQKQKNTRDNFPPVCRRIIARVIDTDQPPAPVTP